MIDRDLFLATFLVSILAGTIKALEYLYTRTQMGFSFSTLNVVKVFGTFFLMAFVILSIICYIMIKIGKRK